MAGIPPRGGVSRGDLGRGFDASCHYSSAATNHLFTTGNLTVTDVAGAAGVAAGNDATNASADSLWLDFNNDKRQDLLVVRFGQSLLYQNLGSGKFRDVTKAAGLTGYANAITAVAFDYDHDGFVDLFIGAYFQRVNLFKPDTPRFFPESFETANNGGGLLAYRNNGNGTFTDVTDRSAFAWRLDPRLPGRPQCNGWDDLYRGRTSPRCDLRSPTPDPENEGDTKEEG